MGGMKRAASEVPELPAAPPTPTTITTTNSTTMILNNPPGLRAPDPLSSALSSMSEHPWLVKTGDAHGAAGVRPAAASSRGDDAPTTSQSLVPPTAFQTFDTTTYKFTTLLDNMTGGWEVA